MKKYQKIILSIVTAFIAVFSICFSFLGSPLSANARVTPNANHGIARYFKFADYGTNLNNSYIGRNTWTFNGNIYYAYNQVFEDYAPRYISVSHSGAPSVSYFGEYIWTDGVNTYYSNGSTHRKLTANSNSYSVTFSSVTFTGLTSFYGYNIWSFNGKCYYYDSTNNNFMSLIAGTTSWVVDDSILIEQPNGSFINDSITGEYVFTIGDDIYYFLGFTYKFNKSTLTFELFNELNSLGISNEECIWSDGYDVYYSNLSTQFIFNPIDGTWSNFDWTFGGIGRNYPFYGYDVFIYNDLIYTKYNNGSSNLLFVSSNLIYKKGYDLGKTDGYNAGYQAGYQAGTSGSTADSYNQGYQAGYQAGANANTGYQAGYDVGYEQGYNKGLLDNQSNIYNQGYQAGNSAGYGQGYNEGIEDGSDYSFFSLFGAVLDAPISALKGLLNFQIFGVNLLTLFTGLLTLAIILLVLKLMRGGK